jgi:hypothetical protein
MAALVMAIFKVEFLIFISFSSFSVFLDGTFHSCGLIGLYFFNREILQEICDGRIGERLSVIV